MAELTIGRRALGRTGVEVSMLGLGGHHIGVKDLSDGEAERLIRAAVDAGITFLDNSWDYNEGRSEERMGRALQGGYRERVYLMTKIDGRDRRSAARQLEESLRRLQVDTIDLVQHHEVIRFDDADVIFGKGGAQEALGEAQRAGKVRHIGFTGHKDPHIHLYMLEVAERHGFTFDACQMPVNCFDPHFRSFEKLVLPELVRRGVGVLGMKALGDGVLLKSGAVEAEECLRYSLSQPVSVQITGIDSFEVLEQALRVARRFRPMDEGERGALLERTRRVAAVGEYEIFKTTRALDATAQKPEWLGEELERTKELAPA
ncbi:MAG: aldo/keto reductase [Bryobacteraceae bacterium]|nr:aldo/keto reductase [Bryobacteraceae bacterium]